MRIAIACIIALASSTLSAQAADQSPGPGLDCKTAEATPAIEECVSQEYHAVDLRLNETLRSETASIDKTDVPPNVRTKWHDALAEAQRHWVEYRDAECTLTGYEWYGGSGRPGAETTCMIELTKDRIEALLRHAKRQ